MDFRVERDVMVPMRDGTRLATDVWLPEHDPAPVLLVRIPYDKSDPAGLVTTLFPDSQALLRAGYAIVWQDCRGTFASEGAFTPLVNEHADGADTIAWIKSQPWCNGRIGTFGASYLGFTQWTAATQQPEGLQAIASTVSSIDYYRHPHYSEGGAMSWHLMWFWSTYMAMADNQRGNGDPDAVQALMETLEDPAAPLTTPSEQEPLKRHCSWWPDWLAHPDRDEYWQDMSVTDRADTVLAPSLNIGGWFDIFAGSTTRAYTQMKAEAGSPQARAGQRLIMGPWDHMNTSGVYANRQFPLADVESADLTGVHVAYFDHWLQDDPVALVGRAPVRIFVMGIDQWRDEADWPLPDTKYVDYYLDSAGSANTAGGDGILSLDRPSAEVVDRYTYDPARPVPTVGGRVLSPPLGDAGPADQSVVEARDDVLCFTTPVLDDAVEVTGTISLTLHVATSAKDTDFTGKLVDVYPDGRALYLTDGILRTRYRNSLSTPELLEPETVYEVTLDLSVTSNVFLPGHRIRLEVSSSNFPRFDRNTNTGGAIAEETLKDAVVATNQILHGPSHLSRLTLPIIDR